MPGKEAGLQVLCRAGLMGGDAGWNYYGEWLYEVYIGIQLKGRGACSLGNENAQLTNVYGKGWKAARRWEAGRDEWRIGGSKPSQAKPRAEPKRAEAAHVRPVQQSTVRRRADFPPLQA
jgi:hypothetical protein